MHVYPPQPLHDKYGVKKPFDPAQYRAFQDVLKKVGIEDYLKAKAAAAAGTTEKQAGGNSRWYDIARRIVKIQERQLRVKIQGSSEQVHPGLVRASFIYKRRWQ